MEPHFALLPKPVRRLATRLYVTATEEAITQVSRALSHLPLTPQLLAECGGGVASAAEGVAERGTNAGDQGSR